MISIRYVSQRINSYNPWFAKNGNENLANILSDTAWNLSRVTVRTGPKNDEKAAVRIIWTSELASTRGIDCYCIFRQPSVARRGFFMHLGCT